MTIEHLETLRAMKRNRPFVPFRIVTNSETFIVSDRFQFAVGQSEIAYARPASGGLVHVNADRIASVDAVGKKSAT